MPKSKFFVLKIQVITIFMLVGVVFIPIGVAALLASRSVSIYALEKLVENMFVSSVGKWAYFVSWMV
jgi:hypothetical protein